MYEQTFFNFLVRDVIDTAKSMQAFDIVLGQPPEFDSNTLLLKMPNILIREHGEIKSVLTRKLPPC